MAIGDSFQNVFPNKDQFDLLNVYLSIIAGVGNIQLLDAYAVQRAIRNNTIQNTLSVGDFFTVGRGGTDWLFQVAAFDYDIPVNAAFTHSMRLLMYPCFATVALDAQEAIYYATAELAAGTYYFSYGGHTYSFTTTQTVPSGGQITLTGSFITSTIDSAHVSTFTTRTSTSALDSGLTITKDAGSPGTQLTTINDMNRAINGSGNYAQSAMRQWLNSAATTGWWTPSNIYDRPQSSPTDGFLHGVDADLLACIGKVRLRTVLNPADNAGTAGHVDTEELIFLPSRTEMGLGNSVVDVYETPVAADGTAKTTALPLFARNADRIKYLSGVARNWWMRSPNPGANYAHVAYLVMPDGTIDNGNGRNISGVAPACVMY